jgi:hypothetical protein
MALQPSASSGMSHSLGTNALQCPVFEGIPWSFQVFQVGERSFAKQKERSVITEQTKVSLVKKYLDASKALTTVKEEKELAKPLYGDLKPYLNDMEELTPVIKALTLGGHQIKKYYVIDQLLKKHTELGSALIQLTKHGLGDDVPFAKEADRLLRLAGYPQEEKDD